MSLFDLSASTNSRKVPILNADYPHDVTMKATDGNATFTAVISKDGRPDKYTYQWYVDGAAVVGATAAEYVRNVSSDKGVHTLWCEVSNKAGTVRTREATLTVYRLPVLHASYPANGSVYVGTTITVQALIAESGYPNSYTYKWYKDGSLVPGANGSSYSFYRTTEGTSTVFCVVKNDSGTVTTRTATITANRIYLYLSGDQCSAITGGWAEAISSNTSSSYVKFYEDSIYLKSEPNVRASACGTINSIDLSKQSRLTIQAYKGESPDGYFYMAVSATRNSYDTGLRAQKYITGGIDYYSMDISNVSAGHIILCAWAPNSVQTAGIYQVWLG